jgi:CBS domain-containing protein
MSVDESTTPDSNGSSSELVQLLAGVQPFDSLSTRHLDELAAAVTLREFAAGELIVDAFTAPPTEIFVALEGEVDIWQDPDRVKRRPTNG